MGLRARVERTGSLAKNAKFNWHFDARFSSHPNSIFEKKIPHFRGELFFKLERAMGLEPTTAAMARRYSSQLSYAREEYERHFIYFFEKSSFYLPFHI